MPRLLTIDDVAQRMALSTKNIRRLIACGDLAAIDVSPTGSARRTLRIEEAAVHAFVARRSGNSTPVVRTTFRAKLEAARELKRKSSYGN